MDASALLKPAKLWTRTDCMVAASPVPREAGVYAWYFVTPPPGVPVAECRRARGATLLYVGISPRRPSARDDSLSRQTLRARIRNHYRGNASGSTLRLTLGCLLEREIGISLQRVGKGDRCTFGEGEGRLSEWMGQNALVTWLPVSEPWRLEEVLIRSLSLPLNLQGNVGHPFHGTLSALRRDARARALG